jgi:hypothetical protein
VEGAAHFQAHPLEQQQQQQQQPEWKAGASGKEEKLCFEDAEMEQQ